MMMGDFVSAGKFGRVGDVASFLSPTVPLNHTHLGGYTRIVSLHRVGSLPSQPHKFSKAKL